MTGQLSPRQFAEAIGVSESSVRRWADSGRIQMTKTGGGHRKIPRSEAIRFIRESDATVVRPDLLEIDQPGHRRGRAQAHAGQQKELLDALEKGKADVVSGLLITMYVNGVSAAEICDGPLRYAMQCIGAKWPDDPRSIFVEHRATNICVEALNHLRTHFRQPRANDPVALGGAPAGDPFLLPSLMANTVLTDVGFRTVNLGPNTPVDVLGQSALELEAKLVWIALTSSLPKAPVQDGLAKLVEELLNTRTQIVIGGLAARRYRIPSGTHVHTFSSMGAMANFAKGLEAALRPLHGE